MSQLIVEIGAQGFLILSVDAKQHQQQSEGENQKGRKADKKEDQPVLQDRALVVPFAFPQGKCLFQHLHGCSSLLCRMSSAFYFRIRVRASCTDNASAPSWRCSVSSALKSSSYDLLIASKVLKLGAVNKS